MTGKKKSSGTRSLLSKKNVAKVMTGFEASDSILYARVKPGTAKFFKDKAEEAGLSLSKFMDQLADKLKGV